MKDKILTFIIGLLVGAIIATAIFYSYSKSHTNTEFTPGDRPEMFDKNGNGGTPPDMQNGKGGGPGGNRSNKSEKNKDGNSVQDKKDNDDNSTNKTSSDSNDDA